MGWGAVAARQAPGAYPGGVTVTMLTRHVGRRHSPGEEGDWTDGDC
jgi:hypothetical protein